MTLPTSPELAYTAARTAVAWADLRGLGWLRVSGRDRLDFLQRLSTNDFRKLTPGAGLPTVLATATGPMIALRSCVRPRTPSICAPRRVELPLSPLTSPV